MKTIYKYPLEITDQQIVSVPFGAEPLSIQIQDGYPVMWCLVDPDAVKNGMHIHIFGTGHNIYEDNLMYIDTFQMQGGALVLHAFSQAVQ